MSNRSRQTKTTAQSPFLKGSCAVLYSRFDYVLLYEVESETYFGYTTYRKLTVQDFTTERMI
jgi:hypothetical protein